MPHGRSLNKSGEYLAGEGYGARETLVLTWKGIPTSITSTGWIGTNAPSPKLPTKINTGYPDQVYTFTRKVARVTA